MREKLKNSRLTASYFNRYSQLLHHCTHLDPAQVSYSPRVHSVAHMLLVTEAQGGDAGQYRCTARNEVGSGFLFLLSDIERSNENFDADQRSHCSGNYDSDDDVLTTIRPSWDDDGEDDCDDDGDDDCDDDHHPTQVGELSVTLHLQVEPPLVVG